VKMFWKKAVFWTSRRQLGHYTLGLNFAISVGLAGRSYNSVSTAVLHCDKKSDCCDRGIETDVTSCRGRASLLLR